MVAESKKVKWRMINEEDNGDEDLAVRPTYLCSLCLRV